MEDVGYLLLLMTTSSSLTHRGSVTICISKLTIIDSDNGLPLGCQAIIWTNAGMLLVGPLGTYFSKILSEILTFSFKKMHLKMSSGKWWPFCLSLNVLTPAGGNKVSLSTTRRIATCLGARKRKFLPSQPVCLLYPVGCFQCATTFYGCHIWGPGPRA